jgi:predicted nucleic acid-binding protein
MIVADASVILEVLLNTKAAQRIIERIFAEGESMHAPHVLDLEVAQVLRRYSATRELDPRRGQEALQDYLDFPIARYPHDVLLPRIWELRNNMTSYDAAYVALAEALNATLLTRDGALASAAGHHADVELI